MPVGNIYLLEKLITDTGGTFHSDTSAITKNSYNSNTEAIAAITAVSTVTGKTGATIGDSWKSILANLDFKKAQAALEAYNIKLYEVGKNGEKVQRQGAVVLTELLQQYAKLDDEGQKKLATAIAGGRRKLAA